MENNIISNKKECPIYKGTGDNLKKLLLEHFEENNHFDRFMVNSLFVNLTEYKNSSNYKKFYLIFKQHLALLIARIFNNYRGFISKITKYYPFSLFWQDKLYHHNHLPARNLMTKFENISKKANLDIHVFQGGYSNGMCNFEVIFDNEIRDKEKTIQKLEKVLQNEFASVYVRPEENNGIRILIPAELLTGFTPQR